MNKVLNEKQTKWSALQKECADRMTELGEYFSGEKALTRVKRNETLMKWFHEKSEQINGLDFSDSVLAGRKIQSLTNALKQVQEFHQVTNLLFFGKSLILFLKIEQSVQVKQFLSETCAFLNQMLRIVNIKEEILSTIGLISDIGYCWQIIDDYVPYMQARIKRDPTSVLKLRATFLKLASIIQLPVLRINQASSPDFFSVSEYYSGELVDFVRKVLEIVPRSMFQILSQIIELQTTKLKELQTKCERDNLYE